MSLSLRMSSRAGATAENDVANPGLHATVTEAVERNGEALLMYFARRVDQPEDAADLLADTLLVVWRRARHLPSDATEARMWMFGAARNILNTHRRGQGRRIALAERLRLELTARYETVGADGGSSGHDDGLRDYVRALLADLEPRDREIITLVHWEEMSLTDVASHLGMRASTVRSRYARTRARLLTTLNASGDLA